MSDPIRPLTEMEREAIIQALHLTKGYKPAACQALGISLKTLYNKSHKYGIPLQTGRTT